MIGQVENGCSSTVMRFFLLLSTFFPWRLFCQFFRIVFALAKYDQNCSHNTNLIFIMKFGSEEDIIISKLYTSDTASYGDPDFSPICIIFFRDLSSWKARYRNFWKKVFRWSVSIKFWWSKITFVWSFDWNFLVLRW